MRKMVSCLPARIPYIGCATSLLSNNLLRVLSNRARYIGIRIALFPEDVNSLNHLNLAEGIVVKS